ncbi:MAG: hypothetical protein DCC58_01840 [Chloroflexi bacterium]|nr:MAG: hypothetical protein DCC58_01840 [Chloroflexota bacterium]
MRASARGCAFGPGTRKRGTMRRALSPGTPRLLPIVAVLALLSAAIVVAPAAALPSEQFAHPAFDRTWSRTDKPVEDGEVARTWVYGSLVSEGAMEPYSDSPGGTRLVQYFDKARMEITHPDAVDDGLWYVTTGLLVVEMMTGQMQVGDSQFENIGPADIPVAGDPDDSDSPTYAELALLRNAPPAEDGAVLTEMLHAGGHVMSDPALAQYNVTAAHRVTVPGIDHQVASVFWAYMNSAGIVWEDGAFASEPLFLNPFYATGLPITEAYWVEVSVGGTPHTVLLQCFERRCLTYTPENAPEWQVEMGNVGLHYWNWRHATPPVAQLFIAKLTGANEVPAVDTPTSGLAVFALSDDHETISYYLEVENITDATMAHIHIGAEGVNGSVLLWLYDGRDDPFTGSGVLAEGEITADELPTGITPEGLAQLAATGGYYVNVHTTANPAGEVRGQIGVADELVFAAELEAGQEVADPPVESDAAGTAALFYSADSQTLEYTLTIEDIDNTTAAHIHVGHRGENGPVVAPLSTPTSASPSSGAITSSALTGPLAEQSLAQLIYLLLTDHAYVNVHTSDFPAGEIRGQVDLLSPHSGEILFYTELSGVNEVPAVDSDGSGMAAFRWHDGNYFNFTLALADVANVTAAHIHLAREGQNGPVVALLYGGDGPTDGEVNGVLSDGSIHPEDLSGPLAGRSCARLAYEMLSGTTYVNVHTSEHPAGEVRGQIAWMPAINGLFIAELSGDESVPPVDSEGTGFAVFLSYRDAESSERLMDWTLVVSGVEDMLMSHVHQGGPDDNGPVVVNLVLAGEGATIDAQGFLGAATISAADLLGPLAGGSLQALYNDFTAGNAYVNIHSTTVPSGEIRGAVVPLWLP